MTKFTAFGSLLLLSSALVAPSALAQQTPPSGQPSASTPPVDTTPPAEATDPQAAEAPVETPPEEQAIEISAPGAGEIVVTGRRDRNQIRTTPQVLSVLSSEDIARTGEGDIAGALSRVTGLSVVGNGFVYVRGLGDRYSSALLNGSPLPSPEPLRRVVPLDIFPTSIVASALVQKSYSANYPGEFGGGVINLTTQAVPDEPFFSVGISASGDSETTGHHGYSYYGSDTDWTGFDDGTRDFPAALRNTMLNGTFNATTAAERRAFAASLVNAPTTIVQRVGDIPVNFSGDIAAGRSWDFLGGRLGVIASFGISNTWRTRDALQQSSQDPGLASVQSSFQQVQTDNRVIVNGLIGLGYEIGEHRFRLTQIFIRDSLKQGRLASGFNISVEAPNSDPNVPDSIIRQSTYWFERQLADIQAVGELRFGPLRIDLRGTLANTQRESPYERDISYVYLGDGNPNTRGPGDVDDYVNNLTSGGQSASIAFSDLVENVRAGSIDLAYNFDPIPMTLSVGYGYTETERTSYRFQFQYFRPEGALPLSVAQARPDYLLSDYVINNFNVQLRDVSGQEGAAAYGADLRVHAGYGQADLQLTPDLRLLVGVRYETADQSVSLINGPNTTLATSLSNDYFLPAVTATWSFAPQMQFRIHGSKTIARPQFRELAPQVYQDFDSDREYTGNPFLQDSTLINGEARYEYYFGRNQRFSLAGFYKRIDNPIETAAFFAGGGQLRTGFANAPSARLYGAEVEFQGYLPLESLGGMFTTRRLLFIGNYTYSQSEITANGGTTIGPDLQPIAANLLFRDGAPMTGQSEHLVNLQLGLEDTDRISQMTFLFNYASERVLDRGPIDGLARQPDIIEEPGITVDFVMREEVPFLGQRTEFKLEIRNIFAVDHQEYQQTGDNRVDINTYRLGRSVSMGLTMRF